MCWEQAPALCNTWDHSLWSSRGKRQESGPHFPAKPRVSPNSSHSITLQFPKAPPAGEPTLPDKIPKPRNCFTGMPELSDTFLCALATVCSPRNPTLSPLQRLFWQQWEEIHVRNLTHNECHHCSWDSYFHVVCVKYLLIFYHELVVGGK